MSENTTRIVSTSNRIVTHPPNAAYDVGWARAFGKRPKPKPKAPRGKQSR